MQILENIDVSDLHTLKLAGKADFLLQLDSIEDAHKAIAFSLDKRRPLVPLGDGSNIVLPDQSQNIWAKVNLKGIELLEQTSDSALVRVAAGENWHQFVLHCAQQGWHGLENLALIPGRVGAAPIQNIGAYGVEVSDFIEAVHAISTANCQLIRLSNLDCKFTYRDSIFKQQSVDDCIITAVEFRLSKKFAPNFDYPSLKQYLLDEKLIQRSDTPAAGNGNSQTTLQPEVTSGELTALGLVHAVSAVRNARLPNPQTEPNAGSFFKNPVISSQKLEMLVRLHPAMVFYPIADDDAQCQVKLSAAWLIEHAGLKGYEWQGLKMSHKHALVLIHQTAGTENPSSAEDVKEFVMFIQQQVQKKFDILLEPEPRFYN